MKDKIALVLIALVVVIVGTAVIYGRSLVRTDRERKALHRRRVEDAEREDLMAEHMEQEFIVRDDGRIEKAHQVIDDDSTVTLPSPLIDNTNPRKEA